MSRCGRSGLRYCESGLCRLAKAELLTQRVERCLGIPLQDMHQLHTSSTSPEFTQIRHPDAQQDNVSGPDLGQQRMTLYHLTSFYDISRPTKTPGRCPHVHGMLTRIAGVADTDHVYPRPVDPAHIGLLQRRGVCITHGPVSWEGKSVHCFISIFVCITIAISWTACLKRAVVPDSPGARMRRAVITTYSSSDT